MSLVINTNSIATVANRNLVHNQTNLNKSLARLSSGSKLIDPTEDVGGLAVLTKFQAAIHRNIRAQQNVQNAISYLQVQDGAIENAISVLDRMSELKTMSLDPTKNSLDIAVYDNEFGELQKQLSDIYKEDFNEIALFDDDENLISISNENGSDGAVTISRSGLFDELSETELNQQVITSDAFVATDGSNYTTLDFTTPTFGRSATVILADGAVPGSVNGSDITSAIKGINDALAAAGIASISASESSDGKLVITGSETFTIAETINGTYNSSAGLGLGDDVVGTAKTYNGVAQTYSYDSVANYNEGDVVTGTRADGTQEAYLITGAATITGTGKSFDEFAALSTTTRLNNSLNPRAQVFRDGVSQVDTITLTGGGGADTFDITVDGNSLTGGPVVFDTDIATTVTNLVTAINLDATLSTIVTASNSGADLILTAVNSGTAFLASSTATNNGGGAATADVTTTSNVTRSYAAGAVVYDDSNGRFYLTRGAAGDYSNASTTAASASSTSEFLSLGTSLPSLTEYEAYDSTKDYGMDDIVSYDGNLYVANKAISNGAGAPIMNTNDWVRLNVAVSGKNSLLNEGNGITDFSVADLKDFIQTAATTRSINGAQQQRLSTSLELLQTNHTNLVAANSRLADVDVASESTIFAKNNILVQASASMLSQANASLGIALSLLQ